MSDIASLTTAQLLEQAPLLLTTGDNVKGNRPQSRDDHLKSADFFNAAVHPTAKFVGDKFSFSGDKVTGVDGTLTLLGKTQPVTLAASHYNCYENPFVKREVCGGDFEATLKRSAWGVKYGLDWGFPDDMRLVIQTEAVKQ